MGGGKGGMGLDEFFSAVAQYEIVNRPHSPPFSPIHEPCVPDGLRALRGSGMSMNP